MSKAIVQVDENNLIRINGRVIAGVADDGNLLFQRNRRRTEPTQYDKVLPRQLQDAVDRHLKRQEETHAQS